MAITRSGNRRWLTYSLATLLACLAVPGTIIGAEPELFHGLDRLSQLAASTETETPVIRSQSPYGYGAYQHNHHHNHNHGIPANRMTFAPTASPWITVSQPAGGPATAYGGPTQMAQAPMDPFAQPGMVPGGGFDPAMQSFYGESPAVWQPYVAAQGKFGNERVLGIGQLMMPLYQDGQSLFFADIRGRFDDSQSYEGNFGLGLRTLVDPTWFIGVYGFYDYKHSTYGNNFHQGTFGVEAMSVKWEARLNGYIPESGTKAVDQLTTTQVVGNNIVVNGGFEKAYYGMDGEIGALLWEELQGNLELRGFVGGYYFDASGANFPKVAGPKGRLEMRLYDCPWFGPESRLTLGVEVQDDSVRDFQFAGLARLEIPLGFFQPTRRLTRMERRMLDRIVRDDDVVTVARQGNQELARDAVTGRTLNNVRVFDATTAGLPAQVAAAAGANSTVVLDGGQGVVNANNIVVADGQVFRGGGFQVVGIDSGAKTTFGTRATINNAVAGTTAVLMQNNSTVADLDITGGAAGVGSVGGLARDGILVSGVQVTGATTAGFNFAAIGPDSTFQGNTATDNQVGFAFNGLFAGVAQNNIAHSNTSHGFVFNGTVANTGLIAGNTASQNGDQGFRFVGPLAGMVTGNSATGNFSDGFRFASTLNVGSIVSNNTSTGNGLDTNGFPVSNANGFNFFNTISGTVSNNVASQNTLHGYFVNPFTVDANGEFSGNAATSNGGFGYVFGPLLAGSVVNGNAANNNLLGGYQFNGALAGAVTNNTATANGLLGNLPANNTANGFSLLVNNTGTFTGNLAQGNANNGFAGLLDADFTNAATGIFSNNTANNNIDRGFRGVNAAGTAVNNTGVNNTNGGNSFP